MHSTSKGTATASRQFPERGIIGKIKICGGNKHRLDYIGSYLINMNGMVCPFDMFFSTFPISR
jgi:hypothetical protein